MWLSGSHRRWVGLFWYCSASVSVQVDMYIHSADDAWLSGLLNLRHATKRGELQPSRAVLCHRQAGSVGRLASERRELESASQSGDGGTDPSF